MRQIRTQSTSGPSTIDLSTLWCPPSAWPHLPENTHPVAEGRDIKIDQVVIGSCTNGRHRGHARPLPTF